MTRNRRYIARCAMAAFLAVLTVIFGLLLGIVRPPWESEAQWHLRRYLYYKHEPGTPDQRQRHRQALINLQSDAVPVIAEFVVTCPRKHDREIAVYLLRDLGPVAHQAIDNMLTRSVIQFDGVSRTDQTRRLLYAQFAAFRDWDAFDSWLSAMEEFDGDLFEETRIEHHVEQLEGPGIPKYSAHDGDRFVINPAFVRWWRSRPSDSSEMGVGMPNKARPQSGVTFGVVQRAAA